MKLHYIKPDGPEPVTAACGHVFLFRPSHTPESGSEFYCRKCNGNTHVPFPLELDIDLKPVRGEWRWKCQSNGGCNSGRRKHGQSYENALYAATRHSRKYPTHHVWLISPEGVVAKRWGGDAYDAGTPIVINGIARWVKQGSLF